MLDKDKKFLNLKVKLFTNKSNGQMSITLPKKKIMAMQKEGEKIPDKIKISLWKW